jgi:hypothetical protein
VSSTNRGTQRAGLDFYPTPDWCADVAIKTFGAGFTLDPCAGNGQLLRAIERAGGCARGIEIQPDLAAQCPGMCHIGDGLAFSWRGESIICNPPFANALEWMEKACREAENAAFLVRLAMLAGKKRKEFWERNPPSSICILSQRPSFTATGTDSADYMWVTWSYKRKGQPTQVAWLGGKEC